jgi:ABC-type multidrug transport system ATPase subunit
VEPAVEVRELSFAYGELVAVDGISFELGRGEVLGFLGPNGAGKSTTIRMLTGQLEPRSGTVRVLGHDMATDRADIQARIGVCFEEKNLYANMSAVENLRFFARLFGIGRLDPEPLLRRVGLWERRDDRVSGYSKGMRQRLMVARTLVNEPDVLFLDEPTDGLDPVSARAIREVVREEAARGAAVLLTTHDMLEADVLSDRVAFIDDGRILTIDTPEALKLAHGTRSVRIRTGADGSVSETVVPLDDEDASDRIRGAVAGRDVLTIHTEEATLEDIFVEIAGRRLDT